MRTVAIDILSLFCLGLLTRAQSVPTNATNLPVGSCTPDIPCSNGACCNGTSGFCGFGPDFCTRVVDGGTCTSNCDALADCGPFAAASNRTCPLNVCCSAFGFCGTTAEFCTTDPDPKKSCQSNCASPSIPSCGADQQSALQRRIGYYEGWAVGRSCMSYPPEQIAVNSLTHINFAFALLSFDFQIVAMSPGDEQLWTRTTKLKGNAPALKVFLSIGGWTFNDPPTQNVFSDLAASSSATQTFIASALRVLETYAFDGIDIDWEYPVAPERGGRPEDKENYVNFMTAVKAAFAPRGYGLTFTAPSSFWYLQHFDLPGLMKAADWVNVMTYDLHGTWDGTDPYIGYVLGAHTNLTEIDQAFQLFWRVGVNPSQVVMGMGFYGRSFTLAEPSCSSPGCPWVSGAKAGPCSDNSGTLMYSEIETILLDVTATTVFDEDAAVKYATWDSNQWVSYDDAESFAVKMNYANDHCLGGTMIWSVDQDDSSYRALEALYPSLNPPQGNVETGSCAITACGATSCGLGSTIMTQVHTNPATPGLTCPPGSPALLCCETADLPGKCTWRGGSSFPCNPSCNSGETILATDPAGNGQQCLLGTQAFCCESQLYDLSWYCSFYGCMTSPTCPAPGPVTPHILITVGTRGQGSSQVDASCTADTFEHLEQLCPRTCATGQVKPFCCEQELPFKNCQWKGTPPFCFDNQCAIGQIQILTDPQGDASQSCIGSGTRAYCCDPAGSDYIPVPFADVFPGTVPVGTETFQVEFDEDVQVVGDSPSGNEASSSWGGQFDDNENDEPFGEIFIESPNPAAVSSLTTDAHWVITGCSASSDQPQEVLAYCSKLMNETATGCSHVFIGQAEHTIVKLPSNCGLGPYGRVVSLGAHPNQAILPQIHQVRKPVGESVYLLKFDYNFAAIPTDNGPVYMRADVTDLPNYWDTVVDSPPERKRWLQERGMWKEKRWWGSFSGWLQKLNTVKSQSSTSRTFTWFDEYVIFDQHESCEGPPAFESSLKISAAGHAALNTRYGFYLQGTIVPPSVDAAYLFFSADADTLATFTIEGGASVSYDSSTVQLASFGFPGLYYPGLLTIGPSLVLDGYISGSLSIGGKFEATVAYKFPKVELNLGKSTSDSASAPTPPMGDPYTSVIPDIQANIDLSGSLEMHLVPRVQLGISVLGGAVLEAEAFLRTDLFAGVGVTGSVSNTAAPQFCVNPYLGVAVDLGVTGSLAFWEAGPTTWSIYRNQFNTPENGICLNSVSEPGLDRRNLNATRALQRIEPPSGAFILETVNGVERKVYPRKQLSKRDTVPFLPGNLFCPAVNDQIGSADGGAGLDWDPYDDLANPDLEDSLARRSVPEDLANDETDEELDTSGPRSLRAVSVPTCRGSGNPISITPPIYSNTATIGYFDLANPGALTHAYTLYGAAPAPRSYGREHVYELQMLALFIDSLAGNAALWSGLPGFNSFCSWARTFLTLPYGGAGLGVVQSLQRCLPAGTVANTDLPANVRDRMVWLEQIANDAKAKSFSGQTIRNQNTFNRYTAHKKIAVFRAVASVMSYMNNGIVSQQFLAGHNCVLQVWTNWFNLYASDPNILASKPNIAQVDLPQVYRDWTTQKLEDFHAHIWEALSNFQTWYAAAATPVALDFPGNLNSANPQNTAGQVVVTANDLDDIVEDVNLQGITWLGQI